LTADALIGAGLAGGLVLLAFLTTGGTDLSPNTWVQIGLLVVAATAAASVLLLGAPGRRWGALTLLLFAALAALTFASIAWSVQPANSWLEANRTLSYLAAFGAALALARIAPGRWPAVVGAVAGFATVVCAYALLVKVFPASLDPGDQLGRLRAPFDYWNATGLAAAIGLPAAVWAGARREGGPVLRALSIPAISILGSVLILSWSRGALLAAVVGVGCWLALVPLRLRAALVLGLGVVGAAVVTLWGLGHDAVTHDGALLPARTAAGHSLGIVLVVVLAVMTLAGFALALAMERVTVGPLVRRRAGTAVIALLALVPIALIVGLAASSRGLTGEVSHAWTTLTNQNSVVTNTPGRIAQLGSSRPRYWSDGLKVGRHALLGGTGAMGFATARSHYSTDPLLVQHAHSYVIETFADFGLIGVALSLGLLVAWLLTVRRTRAGPALTAEAVAERAGLSALLAIAVIFGVHSLIDWTWFVPGVAVPALACAGWLAGRGPVAEPVGLVPARRRLLDVPGRAAAVVAVVAAAALAGWIVWQPLRSANSDAAAATAMLGGNPAAAIADARTAAASDPVAVDPLWELAAFYAALGNLPAAHHELTHATSVQPSNPATWEQLAAFDVQHGRAEEALSALHNALRLDRGSVQARQLLTQARARLGHG
jgi:hypothetical protein